MSKIQNIQDVAEKHLCCGCGVCSYLFPDSIRMVDDFETGRRPIVSAFPVLSKAANEQLLFACPGVEMGYKEIQDNSGCIEELFAEWGPIRHVLEGYSSDQNLRFAGSSGGVASTLAMFGIEQYGFHGVLHIAARDDYPFLNQTVLSTSREQITSRMGSRYSPASPCDGLKMIVDSPKPCVIIGKPCDIAAIYKAKEVRPELADNIGLTVSIFCAATPSTQGTLALLDHLGVTDKKNVSSVSYRGNGWPGSACVIEEGNGGVQSVKRMSYADSWGKILCHYRQWRCNLCVDHTGELADISVGDPWYRDVSEDDPGRSLVLTRTSKGKHFIDAAITHNYLMLNKVDHQFLAASQPSLLNIRRSVWGRLFALRLAGAAVPKIYGIPILQLWISKLPLSQKFRSILGTLKRVVKYKLWKRRKVEETRYNDKQNEKTIS